MAATISALPNRERRTSVRSSRFSSNLPASAGSSSVVLLNGRRLWGTSSRRPRRRNGAKDSVEHCSGCVSLEVDEGLPGTSAPLSASPCVA